MNVPSSLSTLMPTLVRLVFSGLPNTLYYHNQLHTENVVKHALQLAAEANLTDRETELLYAAAVLHDSGYSKKYKSNEGVAAILASKLLPDLGFTKAEIKTVKSMILATNLVVAPVNKLEMLLSDADMGYLGDDDFMEWSNRLFKEWQQYAVFKGNDNDWLAVQVDFLEKHSYFTPEANALFSGGKKENLQRLKTAHSWPK